MISLPFQLTLQSVLRPRVQQQQLEQQEQQDLQEQQQQQEQQEQKPFVVIRRHYNCHSNISIPLLVKIVLSVSVFAVFRVVTLSSAFVFQSVPSSYHGNRCNVQAKSILLQRYHLSSTSDVMSRNVISASSVDTTTDKKLSSLHEFDPVLAELINQEEQRQRVGLELIASENFCSANVRAVLGSCLTNKYSEGYVGRRYYGGNIYIDQIESLCMKRALALYQLDSDEWGVNVQPYSGSPANFAVYTAVLQPHDRIMGLDLPSGGHLTHGYRTAKGKPVSATSVYFESMPYIVSQSTGLIDYEDMERRALMFLPKLLIAGGSAYPREWDYGRMKSIAEKVGALFMVDMAHISGLVAANVAKSPFDHADIVTTTTHKSLRGPRSGMIFAKKHFMDAINTAVFPALQGGPHNHQIAALAVALQEASQPEFQQYARQIVRNAQALARGLEQRGHTLATGGTDNHLMLWNVRRIGLTGSKVERVLELSGITTNKNSIPGDTSAFNPGGVRLGTPALTTRGLLENDFEQNVAEFLHRGCQIALQVQLLAESEHPSNRTGTTKVLMKDFLHILENHEPIQECISNLKRDVEEFVSRFDMP